MPSARMRCSSAWAARASIWTARPSRAPASSSCSRNSSTPCIRSAGPHRSLPASRRWTSFSTRRPDWKSSALPPELDTARFYENHIRRYGYDYPALGFGRRSSQEKRFQTTLSLGDLHGKRLLDVGCGFGDLLSWLNARGIEPRYTGIDICRPMIERCRKRFGKNKDGQGPAFQVADALTFVTDHPYDYIVASGIFGYNA